MYEGGKPADITPKKKTEKGAESEEKPKELTPEEKEAKRIKDETTLAQAKKLLSSYIAKHKMLMFFGFLTNLAGMVGEFVSPLFIGWVVDAITESDFKRVKEIIILWMIMNTIGAFFSGVQRYVFQITTERIGQDLRQDVF